MRAVIKYRSPRGLRSGAECENVPGTVPACSGGSMTLSLAVDRVKWSQIGRIVSEPGAEEAYKIAKAHYWAALDA